MGHIDAVDTSVTEIGVVGDSVRTNGVADDEVVSQKYTW